MLYVCIAHGLWGVFCVKGTRGLLLCKRLEEKDQHLTLRLALQQTTGNNIQPASPFCIRLLSWSRFSCFLILVSGTRNEQVQPVKKTSISSFLSLQSSFMLYLCTAGSLQALSLSLSLSLSFTCNPFSSPPAIHWYTRLWPCRLFLVSQSFV